MSKRRNLFIFAGINAAARASQRENSLVLPEGKSPAFFRGQVDGCEITLFWPDATRELIIEFGEHLVRCGADLVAAPFENEAAGGLFFRPRQ